ncbi:MAG TPA: GNAT family N-acetyltransferase [Streptosporangiaceae bacterium]|nr:GNAT family N-acetyltransferase [Streptosporangiaceae bacterium]
MRPARPYDAEALLELKRQLDRETAFMMYEPGERDSPVQDLAAELASLARSANSVVLLAERGDQLIGYVQLTGGALRRSRATAYVVIGVLAHAAGRGTGTELLRQAKAWAAAHGLHRLELTVMAHNARAIRLYGRTGFTVEGRRSECLLVDGQFIDELTMATLLPTPPPPPPYSRTPIRPRPRGTRPDSVSPWVPCCVPCGPPTSSGRITIATFPSRASHRSLTSRQDGCLAPPPRRVGDPCPGRFLPVDHSVPSRRQDPVGGGGPDPIHENRERKSTSFVHGFLMAGQ